jgi:hypothetical protein
MIFRADVRSGIDQKGKTNERINPQFGSKGVNT